MGAGLTRVSHRHVMDVTGDIINLILGTCGIVYSLLPPERVRNYRRNLALLMRGGGICLLIIALTSLFLKTVGTR